MSELEEKLVAALKEAVDDQRRCEVIQGMIEWYDGAVSLIESIEGVTEWVVQARYQQGRYVTANPTGGE